MQIGKLFFPITSLGPGNRLGIWTLGCLRKCRGCSNPELQELNEKNEISIENLLSDIDYAKADGVTISGGEPFLQAAELKKLVETLLSNGLTDILIFTGFTIKELQAKKDADVDYVLDHIAVLIDGPFEDDKTGEFILKGSSNQKIHILNKQFKDIYDNYLKKERSLNIISMDNGEIHFIGIPPKDYRDLYNSYIISRDGHILLNTQEHIQGDKNE